MLKYVKKVFRQYADFKGRARRAEYWYFSLFNFLLVLIGEFLATLIIFTTQNVVGTAICMGIIYLYYLAAFIPTIAVNVRRLHDIGRSGWWLLISIIPIIGAIVLLIFTCTDSQKEENKWGISPKYGDFSSLSDFGEGNDDDNE